MTRSAWPWTSARTGPVHKTFAALDPKAQAALHRDLLALIDRFNRSRDGSMVVPGEYLEIVITRH